ncbi:MAG TPA: cytochrome c oxidase subunit II [Mucilaginibacter sp.]|nr:cytochrome c oxidase subunit II [Mucilaginibacter sp.]
MSALHYIILQVTGPSIFNTASPEARKIGWLGNGFLIAGTAMMLLVIILTVRFTLRYRAKENDAEPPQTKGSHKMELLMVGVPLVLVIFFFFWSLRTMSAVMPGRTGDQQPDVIITGHQWWWQADYTASHFSTANEIHLPVGKRILLKLDAADVIHDWWVPALGAKMDMIPGRDNYLWIDIDKPGIYQGACSEFCGEQHAWMRIRVVAQEPAEYQKWLAEQSANAEQPADSLARLGEALFEKASCSNCHSIRGTGAKGDIGPDLTHFARRQTMLSGMEDNTPENVYQWLLDPQKVKTGARMPRFIFNRDSLMALTAYLSQLK